MSEVIIKSRIMKSVKSDLLYGFGAIALGVIISLIAWQAGYIVYWFVIIPFFGLFLIAKGLFQLSNWKSHQTYKNWELYEKNEQIPSKIVGIINNRNPENDFGELILDKDWLVFPENFNFLKYSDINWVYLNRENPKNKKDIAEICVHTRFGKVFKATVSSIGHQSTDSTQNAIFLLFVELNKKSPTIIIGFKQEFKAFWERDARGFSTFAKSNIQESKVKEKVAN